MHKLFICNDLLQQWAKILNMRIFTKIQYFLIFANNRTNQSSQQDNSEFVLFILQKSKNIEFS